MQALELGKDLQPSRLGVRGDFPRVMIRHLIFGTMYAPKMLDDALADGSYSRANKYEFFVLPKREDAGIQGRGLDRVIEKGPSTRPDRQAFPPLFPGAA